ncbi:MAG: chorismate mutase [Micrococcaceae bacterium]
MSAEKKSLSAEEILAHDPVALEDLQKLRHELDQIDEHIISMFARRFMITDLVGAFKTKHKLPAADAQREKDMKAKYSALAEEQGLDPDFVNSIFSSVLEESVKNHKKIAEKNHG